jgi:uncharacterized membrane protein YbhN (UPF0104 family)
MQVLRALLLAAGALVLILLVRHFGLDTIGAALTRIAWWQFALICMVHGLTLLVDTLAWRYTLAGDRPAFRRLLAARCAGQAVNVVTAVGGVGGEAIKAWVLRRDLPYEASVPSLVLAKTAEVTGQTLLLATGIAVGWASGAVGSSLLRPMGHVLLVEVIAVSGFIAAQLAGGVGRVGRVLARLGGVPAVHRIDRAIRRFYRSHWRSLLASVGLHYAGWLLGTVEALLILRSLDVPAGAATAMVVEAVSTGARFVTFFVPASLGTLEGAIAVAFAALGWAASDGLAFSLARRGRQAVWIGVGLAVLASTGVTGGGREPASVRAGRAD